MSEKIQGIPRGACLLRDQLQEGQSEGPGHSHGDWLELEMGFRLLTGTWFRSSGESGRPFTKAAFWTSCLASSVLPLDRSHRGDSGRTLSTTHGCDAGVWSSVQPPRIPVHTEPTTHALRTPSSGSCILPQCPQLGWPVTGQGLLTRNRRQVGRWVQCLLSEGVSSFGHHRPVLLTPSARGKSELGPGPWLVFSGMAQPTLTL